MTGFIPGQLRDGNGHPPHRRPGFTVRQFLQNDARCDQFEMLFDRAFTVEVENRFQSCEEFLARLEMTLKSQTIDEDPAVVADEVAKRLRQHDSKTFLEECAQTAKQVVQEIARHAHSTGQRIKPFSLSMTASVAVDENTFPKEIERLRDSGLTIDIQLHPHRDRFRSIFFVVGAEGNQCVLLRGMISKQVSPTKAARPDPHWEKILWLTQGQSPNEKQLLATLNQSVTKAMRALENDILPSGTGASP